MNNDIIQNENRKGECMRAHFNPPSKEAMKSKLITTLCVLGIIFILYFTCYIFFFRTTNIDLTKDVDVKYYGESGFAVAEATYNKIDYNNRKQLLLESVTYKITPNKNLKNGDRISIEAFYDQDIAKQYHMQPVNKKITITVENLPERLKSIYELTPEFLQKIDQNSTQYIKKNISKILDEDFSVFDMDSNPQLVDYQRVYRLFLDSQMDSHKDRIIDVYQIRAIGETSDSDKKENTIYYLVNYNEINNSLTLKKESVFGEKLIYSGSKDLSKKEDFEKVINEKYGHLYQITYIEDKVEKKTN